MSPARFRPTWQQAVGRGLYLGALAAAMILTSALAAAGWVDVPGWGWAVSALVPPVFGALGGALVGRRLGTDIDARGIRTVSAFTRGTEPWSRVVDLRAERRGARTVVSVYLDDGASVQLRAP